MKELIEALTILYKYMSVEKAFDAGGVFCFNVDIDNKYGGDKQEYILNLKLDNI